MNALKKYLKRKMITEGYNPLDYDFKEELQDRYEQIKDMA